MLVNKIVLILIILFIFVVILEYLKRDIFEGMGAIIGPVISPKVNIVDKPTNTYYENNKITQDFDPYSVIQDYKPNSIIIQEEPGYILTNQS